MRKRLTVRPGRFTVGSGLRATALTAAAVLALSTAAFASADAATVTVTVASHFVWVPTTASLAGNSTLINNGATNGHRKDLLFVTPNLTPGGISPCPCLISTQQPVGVWFDSSAQKWGVFNENISSPMNLQFAYNVLVVPRASGSAFVQRATASNTSGNRTLLSSPLLNGKPNALILVTQNWNPNGIGGTANDHRVGVRYYSASRRWGIVNEDGSPMTPHASFNVLVGSAASNGGTTTVLKATTSNRLGSGVTISNRETNGNPNTVVFAAPDFNPGNKGHIADPNAVDVAYVGSRELVIHWGSGGAQKVGNAFNLLIFSS
jgi:hypothetical protein